jgi:2,5-diamino-6-(ribosylamino)-4(3H)-pyrimidinone 5'-phosphate reductase
MNDRPYVICHMMSSIDGRIIPSNWSIPVLGVYEKLHDKHDADAWLVGRVTMDEIAGGGRVPKRKILGKIPRADFVADAKADSFAIAVDASGKIAWKKSEISGDHCISVLTESVSDAHIAFLQDRGVSYVFAGKKRLDLGLALRKLKTLFGIEKLLLEGGGGVNGSFLAADLIDELSLVIAPVADGKKLTTLFEADDIRGKARRMKLVKHATVAKDFVWMRYTFV